MNSKLLSSLFVLVAFVVSGCNNDGDSKVNESEVKHDVEYYVANPKIAYQVVSECDNKVATIAEHEVVFSQGDCKNAMLAKKQIIKKRNSTSNAMPTYDFSNVNKNTKE